VRGWTAVVESGPNVRPHGLDERVLTVITEAISADSAAFDADVVGGGDRVRAEFDLLAADAQTAAQTACQLFLRALEAAVEFGVPEESVVVERLVVEPARDREL
jgi:hypothetical protein